MEKNSRHNLDGSSRSIRYSLDQRRFARSNILLDESDELVPSISFLIMTSLFDFKSLLRPHSLLVHSSASPDRLPFVM